MTFLDYINTIIELHGQSYSKVTNDDGKLLIILGCLSVICGSLFLFLNRRTIRFIYFISNVLFSITLVLIVGLVISFESIKDEISDRNVYTYENKDQKLNRYLELLYGLSVIICIITNLITLKYDMVGLILYGLLLTQLLFLFCLTSFYSITKLIVIPLLFGIIISIIFYNFKFISEIFVTSFSGAFLFVLSYSLTLSGIKQYVNHPSRLYPDDVYIIISFQIILSIVFGFTHSFFIGLSKPKQTHFFNHFLRFLGGISIPSLLLKTLDKISYR